jgi:hypothetical protein
MSAHGAIRGTATRLGLRIGRRWRDGGVEGNEILTSAAVVLVSLLVAEGVTIVHMRGLLSAHMFIGLVLIGPVLSAASQFDRAGRCGRGSPIA